MSHIIENTHCAAASYNMYLTSIWMQNKAVVAAFSIYLNVVSHNSIYTMKYITGITHKMEFWGL